MTIYHELIKSLDKFYFVLVSIRTANGVSVVVAHATKDKQGADRITAQLRAALPNCPVVSFRCLSLHEIIKSDCAEWIGALREWLE